jgi:glycosyltransferase involved in cell wall biosynthesis
MSRYQGIPYLYTSVLINRPDNFLARNLNKISGYFGELAFLVKKRKSIQAAIFSGPSMAELVYYRIISKVLGFKLIIQYVELVSEIQSRERRIAYVNGIIFDNYCFHFCDGIITISEFLRTRARSRRKSLPIIKIPAICDFDEFTKVVNVVQSDFLMYCGSVGYISVIEFIIDVYCQLRKFNHYQGRLFLAIGAGENTSGMYLGLINKIKKSGYGESIVLEINVPHRKLIEFYLSAELLIVPLRDVVQDVAGFHHKVGEYCAAKKPIISTNRGELQYYFKDGVSAILVDDYSIDSYVKKLSEILPAKEKLKTIAEEGHKVGKEKLNYLSYGAELKAFILNL